MTSSKARFSQEVLAQALEPPFIDTAPGPRHQPEAQDYGMTIGLDRTPGGRLWAAWVGGGDSDLGFFLAASSDDDGETWSRPRLAIDPPDLPELRRRILVGTFWTDPLGRLWLFFDQSLGYFDGRGGDWATVCNNPDATEPVWSAPRRLWHGATLNKPLVLKNGEWLLPVSLWDRGKIGGDPRLQAEYAELDEWRMANVFVSAEQGATWTRRGGVRFPHPEFDEHMLIERRDGSLWMLARTQTALMESTSTDQGRTWSEPRVSAIKTVNARFFIRRLSSGNLLLVKHGPQIDSAPAGRSHLAAFISADDGQTWTGGLVLDERNNISYPDGCQAPDGTIYISHDRERDRRGEILLSRFTEADVLAGRLTGPRSRLKMPIYRPLAAKDAQLP